MKKGEQAKGIGNSFNQPLQSQQRRIRIGRTPCLLQKWTGYLGQEPMIPHAIRDLLQLAIALIRLLETVACEESTNLLGGKLGREDKVPSMHPSSF